MRRSRPTPLRLVLALLFGTCALSTAACSLRAAPVAQAERPLDRIKHLIIIYQENWTFDSLYGKFPGANGLANAGETVRQVDKAGRPYTTLPPSIDTRKHPPVPDPRIPPNLPVAPFDLGLYIPPDETSGNPAHRFYHQQYQSTAARWTSSWPGPTSEGS